MNQANLVAVTLVSILIGFSCSRQVVDDGTSITIWQENGGEASRKLSRPELDELLGLCNAALEKGDNSDADAREIVAHSSVLRDGGIEIEGIRAVTFYLEGNVVVVDKECELLGKFKGECISMNDESGQQLLEELLKWIARK